MKIIATVTNVATTTNQISVSFSYAFVQDSGVPASSTGSAIIPFNSENLKANIAQAVADYINVQFGFSTADSSNVFLT